MEKITMIYEFNDEDHGTELKRLEMTRSDDNDMGVRCDDICEMFLDFMKSAGFSEHNIWDYFKM